jgi:hypothetical protein
VEHPEGGGEAAEEDGSMEAGEEATLEVKLGHTLRGGERTMMRKINTSSVGRETDTTPMTSTYPLEGPWSGTMTTIGTE